MKKGQITYEPIKDQKDVIILSREEYESLQNKILYWVKRAQRAEGILKDAYDHIQYHPKEPK